MIGKENPRDDIIEMLETQLHKPTDMTPKELFERIRVLVKCCKLMKGTRGVPSLADQQVFFHRAMPRSIKDEFLKQGITVSNTSFDEMVQSVQIHHGLYVRNDKSKKSSSGSGGNSQNSGQQGGRSGRSNRNRSKLYPGRTYQPYRGQGGCSHSNRGANNSGLDP